MPEAACGHYEAVKGRIRSSVKAKILLRKANITEEQEEILLFAADWEYSFKKIVCAMMKYQGRLRDGRKKGGPGKRKASPQEERGASSFQGSGPAAGKTREHERLNFGEYKGKTNGEVRQNHPDIAIGP